MSPGSGDVTISFLPILLLIAAFFAVRWLIRRWNEPPAPPPDLSSPDDARLVPPGDLDQRGITKDR